jgi:hypothetical protein
VIRRRLALVAAAAIISLGLAGCSTPALDDATAAQLQHSVIELADLAAAGDTPGAIGRLDQLQTDLDAAIASDLITAARAARVQTAIDAVRADLETLIAAVPAPAPTPSEQPVDTTVNTGTSTGGDPGGGKENSGPGNNNEKDGGGKDNSGKGKGKNG